MSQQTPNTNIATWFEIPVADFVRAKAFYEDVFNIQMQENEMEGVRMALFPVREHTPTLVSGALVYMPPGERTGYLPSSTGLRVYLNCGTELQPVLDRLQAASGALIQDPMEVSPEIGCIAVIQDSEGNCIGLHSHPNNASMPAPGETAVY